MSKDLVTIDQTRAVSAQRLPLTTANKDALIHRVTDHSSLLPTDVAKGIVAEIDASLRASGIMASLENVVILFGSYPRHDVEAPEIYTRAVSSALALYPPDIQAVAVDELTKKYASPPARSNVIKACEALKTERLRLKSQACKHLIERERREKEQADRDEREKQRKEFLARHDGKTPVDVLRETGRFPILGSANSERTKEDDGKA